MTRHTAPSLPPAPCPSAISSAGRIREKNEAASMTPAAKPSITSWAWSEILRIASTGSAPTPVAGAPRAPYCLMGVCFECLVTVDGVGSRQGCLVPVREGMKVETQIGRREAGR